MKRRKGNGASSGGGMMMLIQLLIMGLVHGALGWMLVGSLDTARTLEAEKAGIVVLEDVDESDLASIRKLEGEVRRAEEYGTDDRVKEYRGYLDDSINRIAERVSRSRAQEFGGSEFDQMQFIINHYKMNGAQGFVSEYREQPVAQEVPRIFWPMAGFVFFWWLVMTVFQGEGLEFDIQRRRHPMWEWIQSHPVRPLAAFGAELLAPMMANPVYFSAPIFWWVIFGNVMGIWPGLLVALPLGLAFGLAASCLNKALEISTMLRFSPRNRGAVLGIMSWLGYSAMILPLFTFQTPQIKVAVLKFLAPLAAWLPEWHWGHALTPAEAISIGLVSAGVMLMAAVSIAWWGTNQGLMAGGALTGPGKPRGPVGGGSFISGQNPLYRKELLWFWRDKGAVVQAILIPLTIASFQVFNLRGLVSHATSSWNGICGIAIICGTYFLLVLGPRSLASEGGALWIATTWPKGMEDLLKAKARLWWALSSAIVGLALLGAIWMFPLNWWKILLVAAGWVILSRSLAEKTVTLANAPSSSGEAEPASKGKHWVAMLGTFAFSSGVFTANWSIALMGIVFSSLTAAAMWQNFRARLPFFFDPWSEELPPAPSLMHAMVGIAAMVEVIGIAAAIVAGFALKENLWLARAIAYGVAGVITWFLMQRFLDKRGATSGMIWRWPREEGAASPGWVASYGGGIAIGLLLGGLGFLYILCLRALPFTQEMMVKIEEMGPTGPTQKLIMFILAVGMAPLAEEYLFRGLLYRALDREWGGLHAMLGGAAYFAIYHPPVSWIPVFAVGFCCTWLFKKTGRLGPCVLVHMVYNAIVVGFQ